VVLVAYSLPFLINHLRHGPFLNVAVEDEKIYLARVVDVYRGGSLGNPYLAEHQNAERFMPEVAERLLAFTARVAGLDPLFVVGASRVILPFLIYLLLWNIARSLGMEPRFATLAAMLPPLGPSISWIGSVEPPGTGFFRYFRSISPAFYVVLLMLTLCLVQFAWKKGRWWAGLLSGVGLGLLFYITPVYYWSFAIAGVIFMALFAAGRVRANMQAAIAAASIVSVPFLVKSLHQKHVPEVQQTLARLDLLIPGRLLDIYVFRTFVLSVVVLVPIWLWRHKLGDTGRFVLPFMCAGTLLMVQNVLTNRHLQGYHWVECLIPVWSLAFVAFFQRFAQSVRPVYFTAFFVAVVVGAFVLQTIAYLRLEESRKEDAEFWVLDARMPQTLEWLNLHTPPGSIVIASADVMDSLVLYTHNNVYWADYASQHVMLDSEVQARTESLESWHPGSGAGLPFATDFYLGTGSVCVALPTERFLYSNESEGTCVLSTRVVSEGIFQELDNRFCYLPAQMYVQYLRPLADLFLDAISLDLGDTTQRSESRSFG